jgi:hypothetical protein
MMVEKENPMADIEEIYRRAIDAMTPAERLQRVHHFLNWTRNLYARQLREQLGDVSEERLKWEVALRMYGGDRRTRSLIERKLQDVLS